MEQTSISQRTISAAQPRETVRVTLPNGRVLEGPVGTSIEQFLIAAREHDPSQFDSPIMGGILDMQLRDLMRPVLRDADLKPVLLSDSDGGRIYRRSLVLLLVTALNELMPGTRVVVGHAVPEGGFYCMLPGRRPLNEREVASLEAHMRQIVAADDPISKRTVPLDEAIALFQERGDEDKVRLLEQRVRKDLTLYTLRTRSDYYYGYMVPSTRYLQTFRLVKSLSGFVLQYPTREDLAMTTHMPATGSRIGTAFEQEDEWLDRIGVEDIGRLNRLTREDRLQELVLVAEARHEQQIAAIAREIYNRHHDHALRLVLLAGPSSSGKTTFSKRLALQLLAHGLRPFTLELDNYFVDRELTPRDEQGNYDFEALEAINLPLFNTQLRQLIQGEEVRLPSFNFRVGKSEAGRIGRLTDNQILICEGIHGMNPNLVTAIPSERIYRVYVSALTQLNVDSHNRVSTTDVRMLRRISRDAVQRGHTATATIQMWPSVRRGERRNIFKYQDNADTIFNSSLVYELAALRPIVEPLLLQVEPNTFPYIEAKRLLSFLRWVEPMTADQRSSIPDTSLLREFIGGSILQDYHPGDLETKDV